LNSVFLFPNVEKCTTCPKSIWICVTFWGK